uniref:Uncharacterized protein n=1 Tax=Anopheles atroparvus TaxID=41427 RepID=A0A182J778_ANOAO
MRFLLPFHCLFLTDSVHNFVRLESKKGNQRKRFGNMNRAETNFHPSVPEQPKNRGKKGKRCPIKKHFKNNPLPASFVCMCLCVFVCICGVTIPRIGCRPPQHSTRPSCSIHTREYLFPYQSTIFLMGGSFRVPVGFSLLSTPTPLSSAPLIFIQFAVLFALFQPVCCSR